jgi:hypothetical protein
MFNLNLLLNYKLQHSLESGPPTECPKGVALYKQCLSSSASLFTAFDLISGEQIIGAKTFRTEMSLSYPLDGVIDGRILGGAANNMIVHGSRLPWPLPSAEWLTTYSVNNKTAPISYIPVREQSLVVPLQVTVPRVISLLEYDPDVSITLLFDPEPTPPSEFVTPEVQVGLIIGVIVAVIVVIAVGIAVFAKVIFPYMQRRKEARAGVELDEQPSSRTGTSPAQTQKAQSTWTRSTLPAGDSVS